MRCGRLLEELGELHKVWKKEIREKLAMGVLNTNF